MRRPVTIWSEGTRLAADLWLPDGTATAKHPTVLMCHGWGGRKEHLNSTYAPWWAKSGLAVLTFDYRGWGESAPKFVPVGDVPKSGDEVTIRARPVREVVDPFDQMRDIANCLDFLDGEQQVDQNRIALWGSSYGGGHVTFMGAHDSRVKAIVSQVGAVLPGGTLVSSGVARARAVARARGEIGAIPPAEDGVAGLAGIPDFAKMVRYRPLDHADKIRVPTLVIDAEQEELFDRMENGHALYEIVRKNAPSRYVTFPCKHYAIYEQYYHEASNLARDWFLEHLGNR